jgi:hypothetical protein
VLIAALALVALPGLAGSRAPSPVEPLPVSAFQPLPVPANGSRSALSIGPLDSAHMSDGIVTAADVFIEPGKAPDFVGPTHRSAVDQPDPAAGSIQRPPRYTMHGAATFYDNGTTAMRLPRGTIVVICGAGGCIQRTVTDYGPMRPDRIVDLYRPDFFAICGCASWSGTTTVTVSVY